MASLLTGKLNKQTPFVTVIMAGGSGTRFWPASRATKPKQYLSLSSTGRSLIQDTADRLSSLANDASVLVVTAASQRTLVEEHLPSAAVLAEPMAKNTAPCIGFAAARILHEVGDVPMLVLPADHLVEETEKLCEIYRKGIDLARSTSALITIGIDPAYPETGYGYLKAHEKSTAGSLRVERFVEKPDVETAKHYLSEGGYYWNSGMFLWRPSSILAEIERSLPTLSSQLAEMTRLFNQPNEAEQITQIFSKIDPISIDFGVMEKAREVLLIPAKDIGWNDIGSWSAWADAQLSTHPNPQGNVSTGDAVFISSRNCAVSASKLVAAVGVEGIIVVETEDAILVVSREHSQDVKKVVEKLRQEDRAQLT